MTRLHGCITKRKAVSQGFTWGLQGCASIMEHDIGEEVSGPNAMAIIPLRAAHKGIEEDIHGNGSHSSDKDCDPKWDKAMVLCELIPAQQQPQRLFELTEQNRIDQQSLTVFAAGAL